MIVDQPTPCYGKPEPFDILIDHDRGQSPIWRHALNEATDICGQCPVRSACFTENQDEPWVQAMLNIRKPPSELPTCGTPHGASRHYKRGETACDICRSMQAQMRQAQRAAKKTAA